MSSTRRSPIVPIVVAGLACAIGCAWPVGAASESPADGEVFRTGFERATQGNDDQIARQLGFQYADVKPNSGAPRGARISTTKKHAAEGEWALRCEVPYPDPVSSAMQGPTSKSMVGYKRTEYTRDQIITVSADLYIPSSSRGRVTVIDIEDNRSRNRGVRFQLEDMRVGFNPDKLGQRPIWYPTRIPKDKWFNLTVELTLGHGPLGHVRIWIDQKSVLDRSATTIGANMRGYTTVQAGITSRLERPYLLYMDNFAIRVAPHSP